MSYHNLTDYLIDLDRAKQLVDHRRELGERIVFTNGCFDILHRGHLVVLSRAKNYGDYLIIGLNSDSSVKRLKGDSRPINNQEDRAYVLSGLQYVDKVLIFEEETPEKIIETLKPDVHVKSSQYDPNDYENFPEAKIVKEYGGLIKIINLVEGYSTTNIIGK